MNKYCALIPVYNHHNNIDTIVRSLNQLNLNSILIDDGSDNYCREVLESIASEHETVTMFRLIRNCGKGIAVCKGLKIANAEGYTHAIQIDSDGQYEVEDITRFIEESDKSPHAVVSGKRKYRDIPVSRRFGRMITDLWVWINTLSFCIRDSMCGYRLYPLEKTLEVIGSFPIRSRMAFDTDIIVKLFWEGTDVLHVPVKVNYADDIQSHFNLIKDNISISSMHTALFFGMIKRIPKLLFRRRGKRQ